MRQQWETVAAGVHRCRLAYLDVTVGVVIGAGGTVLIDCGTTLAEADSIAADIAEHLGGGVVTHLVLTHEHFDHVMGASRFPGARVVCAPRVAAVMAAGHTQLRAHAAAYDADPVAVAAALAALRAPISPAPGGVIDLGERIVTVVNPGRGHTDHDLVAVITQPGEPTVVFCGDLVEESGEPVIGEDSDIGQWPDTIDRILAAGGPNARYVPGHGAVVDAGFVARQRDRIGNLRSPTGC